MGRKIVIIALIALILLSFVSFNAIADPGDEHQNGPAGTQPHNGISHGEDDSQPQLGQIDGGQSQFGWE